MHNQLLVCGGLGIVIALVILCIYYMPLDSMYFEITAWLLMAGGLVAVTAGVMHEDSKEVPPVAAWPG
jgi:hypothetical protein